MKKSTSRQVLYLIIISTVIRLVLAQLLELGNDEVYYWTYALFPDASHFDHPPMVGVLIQLTTLNLILNDDFFLRLGPIILAAANTYMIFRIGAKVKNERAGLFAALLFTSSIYCSLIAGFAIIPDAPQVFFWLISLIFLLDFLPSTSITAVDRLKLLAFSLSVGLAILSKYHSAFLWVGAVGYVILFNRRWLKDYSFYCALAITTLVASPIIFWNLQHDFISFTFHSNRVTNSYQIRLDYFLRELAGQIAYNNPINYVLIAISVIALMRKKMTVTPAIRILLLTSLPLYFTFTGFSLFRSTLPHWTGPSFISLIIIASIYWSDKFKGNEKTPTLIIAPSYFLCFLLIIAVYVINYSPMQNGDTKDALSFGAGDFTQDMYGWQYIGSEFKKIAIREETKGDVQPNSDIISYRWFPGAHEDFYVASPLNRKVFLLGDLNDTHKYYWINKQRAGLKKGRDYYHIAVSNYYRDPQALFGGSFQKVVPLDTITITRMNTPMRYAYVYKLENYRGDI